MLANLTEPRQTPTSLPPCPGFMPVQANRLHLAKSGNHIGSLPSFVQGSFHLGFRIAIGKSPKFPLAMQQNGRLA